jgi:hypothetical protein
MNLLNRLRSVADRWVEMNRRTDPSVSLKTLGVRCANNSKLFDRPGMAVATFEATAIWLGDPQNWPLALVPSDTAQALADLGVFVPLTAWIEHDQVAA